MERVINHSEVMPSTEIVTEKSETKNVDLSNNNDKSVNSKNIEMDTTNPSLKEIKDGYYFLRLLFSEKSRILKMADDTEKELEELQSNVSSLFFFRSEIPNCNVSIAILALHRSDRRCCWPNSRSDWQVTFAGNKEVQTIRR
jgi:hypothetical protein